MSLPSLRRFVLPAIALLVLTACGQQDAPAQAVKGYLEALVAKDTTRVITLSCADWETQARTEADSFSSVAAELKDVNCQTSGEDGEAKLVSCTGAILATYQNEQQELSLDRQTYRVVFEGGEWRMCGYK